MDVLYKHIFVSYCVSGNSCSFPYNTH